MNNTYFRRPTYRAPSPPTWACYEQIPYGGGDYSDSESESDSCSSCASSEDDSDVDYAAARLAVDPTHASDDADVQTATRDNGADDVPNMDIDEVGDAEKHEEEGTKKDVKGKQRAHDPSPEEVVESPKKRGHRRRRREPVATLRPILTIHKSQGFVWNQVRPRINGVTKARC
jgi:hypothetical protein